MAHYNSVLRFRQEPPAAPPRAAQTDASRTDEESPGLLISPAFWIGGLLSVAAWVGIAKLFHLF